MRSFPFSTAGLPTLLPAGCRYTPRATGTLWGILVSRSAAGPGRRTVLQDSEGARFHPDLALPDSVVKVTKGVRFDLDQNSAFDQTGLAVQLRHEGIKRLWIGGLAEDVCVLATALDARKEGFDVVVIENATRPVTIQGGEEARRKMRGAGIQNTMQ